MKRTNYKLHLKKDDIVEVIAGKEKGKKGRKEKVITGNVDLSLE